MASILAEGIVGKVFEMATQYARKPRISNYCSGWNGGNGQNLYSSACLNAQKRRYEISAWLSVSQFYLFSKLLSDLAFQLDKSLRKETKESGVSEDVAAESIHSFIQGKRCLIVLDMSGGLQKKMKRAGICFVFIHFQYEENRAPESLKEVALNIMKECGNLPLAIKTTAASLANTTLPGEWQSKLSKLKKVSTPSDPVMDIPKLSYDSLPAHLKACFVYLSFFPKDEEIESCQSLSLEVWEEVWYLKKSCKIHDLLLDLAIIISRENKCAFSVDDGFSKLKSGTDGGYWCRLFLAKKDIDENAISERRPISPTLVCTLALSQNTKIGGNIPAM
ncbi:hypothetical protein SUGI_1115240 [Cryptomeria japonica]|nr:hypothetical protein SUGI_1115240 [Cryptomeria japonica]